MAKRVYPHITPEMHREIWLQWLEGVTPYHIVKNFKGEVSNWGVEKTLRDGMPEEFIRDARFNTRHTYIAYPIDGLLNPMTWEPCLYAVVKLPARMASRQYSRGILTVWRTLKEMGDSPVWVGARSGRIDEDLFIEAAEKGFPAFEIDFYGNVTRSDIEYRDECIF